MNEITIELTNFCPHRCPFCSSDSTNDIESAIFMPKDVAFKILVAHKYDRVIISGGEPLAHPDFYSILQLAKSQALDVVVYSNAITHIAYNAHVIDGIFVECAVTIPDNVRKIRLLKRISQGREKMRPEVSFSRNFDGSCPDECGNIVYKPDGGIAPSPCKKEG